MNFLPLAFGSPLILAGLIALPVIWWLLRMTPPRPQEETFPPLRILAQVFRREEVPSKSPWWMTLLRLLIAGLVILALASPIWNPRPLALPGNEPLAIVIDNGWASAEDWRQRVNAAEKLISDAQGANAQIYVIGTAEPANAEIGPYDGRRATERLQALEPRPIPVDRKTAMERLASALPQDMKIRLAFLSDGLASPADDKTFATFDKTGHLASVLWYDADLGRTLALTGIDNKADSLEATAVRPDGITTPRQLTAAAYDDKGRRIAEAPLSFALGSAKGTAHFNLPVELRNDFRLIRVDGMEQAGATRLIDAGSQRRTVGLIASGDGDLAQPLLSPLHYISRALSPYANLVEPRSADLLQSVPEVLDAKPSVLIMADIGTLPEPVIEQLTRWIENGGTLVRFAGPRLAGASDNDPLLPVKLRKGERALGGTLSWSEPQKLRAFPDKSPFAGLAIPQDVNVNRQVLAEPSFDLNDKAYAILQDGTPLVTGERRGHGNIVLFHIAPDATWSSLPISGAFVEMLRRIVSLSQRTGAQDNQASLSLPPFQLLSAAGALTPPTPEAKPLIIEKNKQPSVGINTPPGFYGNEDGLKALNIFEGGNVKLQPISRPALSVAVTPVSYTSDRSVSLTGPFFAAAAMLLALDTFLMLWLRGAFRRRMKVRSRTASLAILLAGSLAFACPPTHRAEAQEPQQVHDDSKPGDGAIINSVSQTHLAYIITGKADTDNISKAGLKGLSFALMDKTALEPGDPIGVDPAKDELAFYPLIYWPIDPDAPMPSPEAIARVDAYMQQGGTVLFDTRDQLQAGASLDPAASPANQRLRAILDGMNVPPLEPVPDDHVLTKAFFIMPDFPGRYEGSPLWVEATTPNASPQDRPVRTGDGVTPIMITANDFASAWAVDDQGNPLFPTVPNDPMQRIYAIRGGVNIVMYMLTGNYKSDQVHVPALLERLGN
ncbi:MULTISPECIES: DUF4159 domain-containing protein [Brucella]|uniref:N-terminal double-transmembrane domain-containing protein n=2 Tax=Brucella pinnipedialis TaxID=120576 RepID=A0A0E1X3L3_9HYPH|nr:MULTISPECIES: DUF4159 domain-containing protein [Brucella]AEK54862.1 hypothetical protein BPI_I1612 [Brucella pinnipedialis B2/94]AIJ67772.1 hypothetical protein DM38_768 [Brucella suis]AIJ74322.1 hypothetical protein DK65_1931 [Brucella pinnipedialis]EEX87933.1 conserved hypothetical protein [Brucella ceti B1/94]EEY00886.1 conserved hypothetical protein [Brucella pinnipedialis B2/94]